LERNATAGLYGRELYDDEVTMTGDMFLFPLA